MKNIFHKQLTLFAIVLILFLSSTVKASEIDLIVKAKGSKANGIFAHFKVIVNGLECGDKYTSSTCKEYCFSVPFTTPEINEIKIVFDNDLYSIGEDRNLCVHSIIIDHEIPIKPNNETVKYILINGEEYEYCGMMAWNSALIFDITKLRFHPGNVTLTSQAEVNAFSYQYVDGSLTISGKDITDLSSLSLITRIKGSLIIRDNPSLINIYGLNSIIEVDFLSIEKNPKLIKIDGFNSLDKCGGVYIRNNNSIKTIKCFISPDI